jgi:hypothetical protein
VQLVDGLRNFRRINMYGQLAKQTIDGGWIILINSEEINYAIAVTYSVDFI